MDDWRKFMLASIGVKLFAKGWGDAALETAISEPDEFKRLDAQQAAQALRTLGLVGDGLFWTGAYKNSPRLTIALGVAAIALVYAPKVLKRLDPKGWDAADHQRATTRIPSVSLPGGGKASATVVWPEGVPAPPPGYFDAPPPMAAGWW
jgi:hypothetical protein